jgi:hypothetical protein
VTGSINKVEDIFFAVGGSVGNRYSLALNRDTALAFNVHVVENLVLEISVIYDMRLLDKTIRKRGLAVINVRNNTKVSDFRGFNHTRAVYRRYGKITSEYLIIAIAAF